LTDFGLSRIGLLGRQTRESQIVLRPEPRHDSRPRLPSIDSAYLSSPLLSADTFAGGSYFSKRTRAVPRLTPSPPDYLAPEIILGLCGEGTGVDWVSFELELILSFSRVMLYTDIFHISGL